MRPKPIPIRSLEAHLNNPPRAWPRTGNEVTTPEGKRIRVNPAAYRNWKTEVASKLAAFARFRTFQGEVSVLIDLHADSINIHVIKLDSNDPRRKPTGLTGDIDNYAKAVLDALEAAKVLDDDNAVAQLEVRFRP